MKTDDLITMLARDAGPAPRAWAAQRLVPAAMLGLLAALACLPMVKPWILPSLVGDVMWWRKLVYVLALALVAGWWASRLARPAAPARSGGWGLLAIVGAMALWAVAEWSSAPAAERMGDWMGSSWQMCTPAVALMSLPALALLLWALRGLAPTRPMLAGFAAGIAAGGIGAAAYALGCSEVSATFVMTWYTLGVAAVAVLGAVLGPRVLRW
jgi:hypothetical protein